MLKEAVCTLQQPRARCCFVHSSCLINVSFIIPVYVGFLSLFPQLKSGGSVLSLCTQAPCVDGTGSVGAHGGVGSWRVF